jgi:pyruvate/oxaloacetate carboxyltransferase
MKSALEIALEKTEGMNQDTARLSDEQKKAIGEIEKEYQARIAEQEIMVETRIKGAATQAYGAEFNEAVRMLREQLAEEKNRLEREKASRIQQVREAGERA